MGKLIQRGGHVVVGAFTQGGCRALGLGDDLAGAILGHAHDVLGGDDAGGLSVRVGDRGLGVRAGLRDERGGLVVCARTGALGFFLGVGEDLRGALVGLVEGRGGARVRLGDARLGRGVGAPQDGVSVGDDGVGGDQVLG